MQTSQVNGSSSVISVTGVLWPVHMRCCHWPSPPETDTALQTTLTPVSAGLRVTETREKARPSRSGFKLAHNKHTRTKISSAIDGQLLIQHHINQQGNKLQIGHNNIIQMQKYTLLICRSTLVTLLRQPIIWGCTVVGLTKDELWMKGLMSKP